MRVLAVYLETLTTAWVVTRAGDLIDLIPRFVCPGGALQCSNCTSVFFLPGKVFFSRIGQSRKISVIAQIRKFYFAGKQGTRLHSLDKGVVITLFFGKLGQEIERVYNLAGGIDRWSREVDPAVPRY